MARVYRLDRLILEAKRNMDRGVVELLEEYLDDTMAELVQHEYMEGNYVPEAYAV